MKKIIETLKQKWAEYLLEIIVITIGIMVAFTLNNWNEERKRQDTIRGIYSIIKNDLKTDIDKIDKQIHRMLRQDSIFKKVIEKKMTLDDYQSCFDCTQILSGFEDLILETDGLELLSDNSTLFDTQNDNLFIEVGKFYSNYDAKIIDIQVGMSADFLDNWSYWKNNMPWFSDHLNNIENDEKLGYMVNSTDYRNRVSSVYFLKHKVFLDHLKGFKKDALILIENIDKKIAKD